MRGKSFEDLHPDLCDQFRRTFRDYIHTVNGQIAAHQNPAISSGKIAVTMNDNGLPRISNAPFDLTTLKRETLTNVYKDYVNANYREFRQSNIFIMLTEKLCNE